RNCCWSRASGSGSPAGTTPWSPWSCWRSRPPTGGCGSIFRKPCCRTGCCCRCWPRWSPASRAGMAASWSSITASASSSHPSSEAGKGRLQRTRFEELLQRLHRSYCRLAEDQAEDTADHQQRHGGDGHEAPPRVAAVRLEQLEDEQSREQVDAG